ncbi:MAG TPA: 2'-5' RNA ligase family protein [Bryobacteraceae bacterium]|jgi:2'-5' RNA ligase
MQSCEGEEQSLEEQTLGQFALVSYMADPLARFLDDLRMELKPGCRPRAHITILPPRPLHSELADAIQRITNGLRGTAAFRIELGEIEIFETSHVIFLGLARGAEEMRHLYGALNRGCLKYVEPFRYHPHITIAQDLLAEQATKLSLIAKERWANYRGPRGFTVSVLSFVQHVAPFIWTDVAALPLGMEVPAEVRRV